MTKYGFDFFIKRAEILEEMAGRPSPWSGKGGGSGDIILDLSNSVNALMARGGNLPTQDLKTGEKIDKHIPGLGANRSKNRALRYLIYMMSRMDESDAGSGEDDIDEDTAKNEIIAQATNILGIPKEGWSRIKDAQGNIMFKDPDKLYRAAILKGIDTFKEYITSPEFRQKTSNPENIISYVHGNRLPTAASAAKAEKRGAHHGGMSAEDMDRIETSDLGVREQIHRAMGYDRKRKKSLLNPEEPEVETGPTLGGVSNTNIDNAYLITDALEILIDNGKDIKERINAELGTQRFANTAQAQAALDSEISQIHGDYPNVSKDTIKSLFFADLKFLEELYDQYTELHETGIDMHTFNQNVESYKEGKPKSVGRIMDMWKNEIQELQFTADMFAKHMPDEVAPSEEAIKSREEFPGYPKAVTDKFLTTPELKENFKKWNNFRINNMMARQEKVAGIINTLKWGEGEAPGELDQVRRGFEDFLSKRPEMAPVKKGQQPLKKPTAKQKEEEAVFDADSYTPQDYDYPEDEDEESYVMGYMTEQVNKDKFKPKGEFKDRGFKKMSYHEWISKYQ